MVMLTKTGGSNNYESFMSRMMGANLDLENRPMANVPIWIAISSIIIAMLIPLLLTSCTSVHRQLNFSLHMDNVTVYEATRIAEATGEAIGQLYMCTYFSTNHSEAFARFNKFFRKDKDLYLSGVKIHKGDIKEFQRLAKLKDHIELGNAYIDLTTMIIYVNPLYLYDANIFELEKTIAHELLHASGIHHSSASEIKSVETSMISPKERARIIQTLKDLDKEFYHIMDECGYWESKIRKDERETDHFFGY